MTQTPFVIKAPLDVPFVPGPLRPGTIQEGNPTPRYAVLSITLDGRASTILWECTAGRFEWYYEFDETVQILDGDVVLEGCGLRPTRVSAGDIVHFQQGTRVRWHVETHVRKLAFCHCNPPLPLRLAGKALRRLQRLFSSRPRAAATLETQAT